MKTKASCSAGSRERLIGIFAIIWIAILGLSLAWNWHQSGKSAILFAESEARNSFNKDLVYRRWAALQGGVYVPPTVTTPPNPFLVHLPDRDLVTTAGKRLTLVNPAYMTRQVHELEREQYGVHSHITSLQPLNPKNAADPWETEALRTLSAGNKDVVSLETMEGQPYLRLMSSLVTEKPCLKCHAAQGYKEGDIRGGISVSIPFALYAAAARQQRTILVFAHLLICGCGLWGLWQGNSLLRSAEASLLTSEERHRTILHSAMDGFFVVDTQGKLVEVNRTYCRKSGYSEQELLTKSISDLEAVESADQTVAHIQRVMAQGEERFESKHLRKDGSIFDVEISVQYGYLTGGQLMAFVRDITERKKTEQRYRELFESSKDGIVYVDMQGRIQNANTAYIELLGHSEEELKRLTYQQLTPAMWHGMEGEIVRNQILSRGYSDEYEKEYTRKDGTIFPIAMRVWLIKDELGNPTGMWAIVRDITERKRSEEALREREKLYRLLVTKLNDGFFITDGQGVLTFGNDALARIYGLDSPDAIPGTHILDLVAPSAREMTWKIFSEAVSGGKAPGSIEIPTLRKNGEVVQTEVKPTVILQKDGTVTTQGLLIDITERKRAEKALRKSEERLDLALKATQDAVWDWDLSTNEFYYSSRCWDIVGYEENEMEVNPDLWRRLTHPADLERADLIIEAIVGETSFELETRLLHKDGHYVPVLTRGFILRDDKGKAVRLSGTIADLTERKKMEEERRQWERQQQQLQKAESLNRMAGAVAHIFNNKLSTVVGYLELAMTGLPQDGSIIGSLIEAMNAALQASDVSGLMLTYLGQSFAKPEPLELSDYCRGSLPILRATIGKDVVLDADLPSPGPVINANADQIQQVLRNLIINSSEAFEGGQGNIHLAVRSVTAAEIPAANRFPIDWNPQGDAFACIEIKDTGSGIEVKEIEEIFDPFFSTKFTGRGLGLSVVLGVARAHRGVVTVESAPDRGSVFRVFFPQSGQPALSG